MDPFTTTRKTFAEGIRISETGLPLAQSKLVSEGLAKVLPTRITRQRRRVFRRLNYGAVNGFAPICLDSSDPQTVDDAFKARLLRDIPKHDPEFLALFKRFVEREVALLPVVDPSKVDFEEWVTSRESYNEERIQQLREAHYALKGGPPTRRQCSHIDSFVKTEAYPMFKHARMINSRSDPFKAWAGPWVSAVEQIVYTHYPNFIKHVPVPDRPAAVLSLKQAGRTYYQSDFTAFESHFTPDMMEACENVLLRHCLQKWDGAELVCKTNRGRNRCRTRSGVSAQLEGRRMSGDLWTSLGNGFTNLMLAKFLASLDGAELYGFVEGDDGLFATSANLTAEAYARLGFTIKLDIVKDPCKASFCGMIFAESGQIIRDPRKFLATFGWTHSFIQAGGKIMDELLLAKALSTLVESGQCPIVGVLARCAYERTKHLNPRFVLDGYHSTTTHNHAPPKFEPALDTRLLFEEVFGVSVEVQVAIENLIEANKLDQVCALLPPGDDMDMYSRRYLFIT